MSANDAGITSEVELASREAAGRAARPSVRLLLRHGDSIGPALMLRLDHMTAVHFATTMRLEEADLLIQLSDVTGQIRIRPFSGLLFIRIVKSLNRVLAVDLVRAQENLVDLASPFSYRLRGVLCADPFGELLSMDSTDAHAYLDILASCDNLDQEHPSRRPMRPGESRDPFLVNCEI